MKRFTNVATASYILALIALITTIQIHLLSALLAGLLVYQLVYRGEKLLSRVGVLPWIAQFVLLLLISGIVIATFTLGTISLTHYLSGGSEGFVKLMQKMADEVESVRKHMPSWLQAYLPNSMEEWQNGASKWLRQNASQLGLIGKGVGMFLIHMIIGMVIGGLIAIENDPKDFEKAPLSKELLARASMLSKAFSDVVFSQIKISGLNTFLTSIFLIGVMPAMGTPLPFTTTIIILTFLLGLLPIVGNLISNTIIFLIALSISFTAAVGSLIFLIVIHKLEYFVNAKIIGGRINAKAWEILIAMLIMESAFGIAGLVAAPIYYAYIKKELAAKKLI